MNRIDANFSETSVADQAKILDDLNIVYFSCKIEAKRNKSGECIYDTHNHLSKTFRSAISYKEKLVKKWFNPKFNGTAIPLGPRYNLIGIDVDNKDGTVEKFHEIMTANNSPPTLTIQTINDGYHYHYRLSKQQETELININFCSKNDALFGLHVDVKYENQIFFGPGYVDTDKAENGDQYVVTYDIVDKSQPAQLPEYLFNELIANLKPKEPVSNMTKREQLRYEKCMKELEDDKSIIPDEDIVPRLKMYLSLLNPTRWDNYEDWFKLGAIIHYERGPFELFDEMSKLSAKYDPKECMRMWSNYKENLTNHLTIGSLMMMAKLDNFDEYETIHVKDTLNIVNDIIWNGSTDRRFAKLFYQIYCNKFLYDSVTNTFYAINEYNIWNKDDHNNLLLKEIDHLTSYVQDVHKRLSLKYTEENKKKYLEGYKKAMNYPQTYRNNHNIALYTQIYFRKNKLYELFDNVNNKLFAFDNGVYDLSTNEFRLPTPQEYITVTAGYDYTPLNDDLIKTKEEIRSIFRSMMAQEEDMEYLLMTIAQSLPGDKSQEEAFYIWKGQGGNGKGVVRDFIQETYGKYFDSMEIDYLTSKNEANAMQADPIMAKKKDVRIVITTEPKAGIKLKSEKLKQISGKDPIQCRHMYGHTFSFVAKFNVFIQTNYEVKIDVSCNGMVRRLNVQEFPYNFVSTPATPLEKQDDPFLKDKIKTYEYKIAFFHLLLEYYYKLKKQGRIIKPKDIQEQTQQTLTANDSVKPFIDNKLEITGVYKDKIKASELYKAFEEYCGGIKKGTNASTFKSSICRAGATICILKGFPYYRGIKLRDTQFI